jgi:PAS domain S-box-containing protein
MADAFAALDRDWRYTYVNRATERNLGFRREEILGRTVWEVIPEFTQEFESACRRAMDKSLIVRYEEYHARLGRWFENTIYPAVDGITLHARDITERKRIDEALRRAHEGLAQKVDERTEQLLAASEELIDEIIQRTRTEQRRAIQYAITRVLAESDSLDVATLPLLRAIGDGLRFEWGAFWFADREAAAIRCQNIWHAPNVETSDFDAVSRAASFARGQALPGHVWQTGSPTWINDVTKSAWSVREPMVPMSRLRGAIAFPVLLGGQTLGVFEFFSCALQERDEEQLAMFAAIGSQVGQFIERKQAEELLREANQRVELILGSITDEFNAFDREWRFMYINEPALKSIQTAKHEHLRREEIIGKNVWDLFPEHVGSIFYQKYQEAMREKNSLEFEALSPVTNRWIKVNAYPSEQGLSVYYRDITERKREQEQLAYHAYLLENVHDAVIATDERFVLTAWNKGAEQMYGWSADEVLGKNVCEVVASDLNDEQRAEVQRELAGMGRWCAEATTLRKDGTPVYVEGNSIALRADRGEITGYLCINRDISERKMAEGQLRRSEAFLAAGQSICHTGTWVVNFPSGEVFWSEEMFRIYGLDPAITTLSQEMAFQLIHPDDHASVWEAFQEAIHEKRGYDVEHRAILPDGSLKYIHALGRPVLNESGALIEFIGTAMDVTERKGREAALRRSEANLAEGQRISHTGSWAWNAGTGEMFSSRELLRIFGFDDPNAEPSHEDFLRLIHPDDEARVREAFERAVRNQTDYDAAYRIVPSDASIRHIHNVGRPVFNESGTLVELIGTAMDITERKQSEEAVRRAYETVEMVLDSIAYKFFAFDKNWRYTYFNAQAKKQLKLLGKDPANLMGKVLWDEFPNPAAEADYRYAMRERVAMVNEHYYAPLEEWVENRIYPTPDGGVAIFVGYVTERKRAEERLRRSEAYLAAGQRMTHTGSWAWNVSTGDLYWSEEHFQICGLDPEKEKPSFSAMQWIHPDDRAFVQQAFKKAMSEKSAFELDCRVVWKNGTIRYVHSLADPVFDETGNLTEYVGTIMDTTERKLVEEERMLLLRRLMHSQEEERRRMAREMHDQFGQQLSTLTLKLAALKGEHGQHAQLREQLESLEVIVKQLDRDVSFLAWELRPTTLDDLGLQAALTKYLRIWSKQFGVVAELHVSGMEKDRIAPEIETTLYRIAQEALNNVAKHARATKVDMILERQPEQVSLIVEDNGVGFDPQEGLGNGELGLIGMRERASLVGGTIEIESNPGSGATIFVRIPVTKVPDGEEPNG